MARFPRLRRQRPTDEVTVDQLALFADDQVATSDPAGRSLGRRLLTLVVGSNEPRRGRLRRRALRLGLAAVGLMLPGSVMAGASMMGDGGGPARQSMAAELEDFLPAEEDPALDAFLDPELLEAVPVGDGEVSEDVAEILGGDEVIDDLGDLGIPEVALDAYMDGADQLAADDPGCGIRWTLLAAIGSVESNHARFGGAQLRDDGYPTKPIRGIPLDGRENVVLIRDTDRAALDGDLTYDRAVGPMQFIPSTWRGIDVDGNLDGRRDPNNIFDAALGAGVYLCRGGGDLTDVDQRAQAVRRYNNADEYVRVVLRLADMYEGGDVDELPSIGLPAFEPTPPPRSGPAPSGAPSPRPAPAPAPQPGPGPAPTAAPGPRPTATTAVPVDPPTTTTRPAPPTTSTTLAPAPTTTTSTTLPAPPSTSTTVPETTTTTVPGEPPDTAAVGWAPAMREVVVAILESSAPAEPCAPPAAGSPTPNSAPAPAGTVPPCPPAAEAR